MCTLQRGAGKCTEKLSRGPGGEREKAASVSDWDVQRPLLCIRRFRRAHEHIHSSKQESLA